MIHYLIVFLISMVPLIELRAAIPYGLALAEQFALSPLLIYVVAIIGTIIEFGTKIIAFVVATVVALTTIAIAWLFYRPLISIPLIVAAIALIYWCKTRKKKQDAEKPTETTTA